MIIFLCFYSLCFNRARFSTFVVFSLFGCCISQYRLESVLGHCADHVVLAHVLLVRERRVLLCPVQKVHREYSKPSLPNLDSSPQLLNLAVRRSSPSFLLGPEEDPEVHQSHHPLLQAVPVQHPPGNSPDPSKQSGRRRQSCALAVVIVAVSTTSRLAPYLADT